MPAEGISIRWLDHPTGGSELARADMRNSEEEIKRIVVVLVSAFESDVEFNNSLFHGDKSLLPIKLEANVRAGAIGGKIQVASYGPAASDIVGVGVWFPPGHELNGTEEQRKGGGSMFLDAAPEELRKWWLDYLLPVVYRVEKDDLGEGFKKAQWSLLMFAILPEHQRQGIGREMLRDAENFVRSDKVSIELETFTPLDVVIYQRMGFEVRGQAPIETPVGTCTLYQMVKTL